MGALKDKMVMKMELKNFSKRTMEVYLFQMKKLVRYYGILSSRNKQKDITKCRELLGVGKTTEPEKAKAAQYLLNKEIFIGYDRCPNCRAGTMRFLRINIRAA